MLDSSIHTLAEKKAAYCGIDPILVKAIIMQESLGNPFAIRYEANYNYLLWPRDFADKIGSSLATEENGQKTSWGLMQVMGAVARERGFDSWFPKLCEIETGILYGCLHLQHFKNKYGDDAAKLASCYNQGGPRKTEGGMYQNQRYVDSVITRMRGFA